MGSIITNIYVNHGEGLAAGLAPLNNFFRGFLSSAAAADVV
jgi:hypothetical protein